MRKKRVLYVSQEIKPYTGETKMGEVASLLPQKTQENGKDIRLFLPKFGTINERRHQLHEVIRLSGMNLGTSAVYPNIFTGNLMLLFNVRPGKTTIKHHILPPTPDDAESYYNR